MQAYLPPPFCRVETAVARVSKAQADGLVQPGGGPRSGIGRPGMTRQQLVGVSPARRGGRASDRCRDSRSPVPGMRALIQYAWATARLQSTPIPERRMNEPRA